VAEVAGADAQLAIDRWGFTEGGNFEGHNIPVHASDVENDDVERVRAALLQRRETRERPATDTKVLASWNGLAAAALAEAGTILDRPDLVVAATEAADFVLTEMRVDGRLMRAYRDGVVKHLAFAEDHAAMIEACLALYDATLEYRWIEEATALSDAALDLFHEEGRGGFFTTGRDSEQLITRGKDLVDNAVPSANSMFAEGLQRLALITGKARYEEAALGVLRLIRDAVERSPLAFATALGALDLYLGDPKEIVLLQGEGFEELLEVVRAEWRPHSVLVTGREGDEGFLLKDRKAVEGRATAYVCRRGVCRLPVTDPDALAVDL
jgi:uncharacterized protein YyaL (SSP411 family)